MDHKSKLKKSITMRARELNSLRAVPIIRDLPYRLKRSDICSSAAPVPAVGGPAVQPQNPRPPLGIISSNGRNYYVCSNISAQKPTKGAKLANKSSGGSEDKVLLATHGGLKEASPTGFRDILSWVPLNDLILVVSKSKKNLFAAVTRLGAIYVGKIASREILASGTLKSVGASSDQDQSVEQIEWMESSRNPGLLQIDNCSVQFVARCTKGLLVSIGVSTSNSLVTVWHISSRHPITGLGLSNKEVKMAFSCLCGVHLYRYDDSKSELVFRGSMLTGLQFSPKDNWLIAIGEKGLHTYNLVTKEMECLKLSLVLFALFVSEDKVFVGMKDLRDPLSDIGQVIDLNTKYVESYRIQKGCVSVAKTKSGLFMALSNRKLVFMQLSETDGPRPHFQRL